MTKANTTKTKASKTNKTAKLKPRTEVWLMTVGVDPWACGDAYYHDEHDTLPQPAIDIKTFGFLRGEVLSFEKDENGNAGYWLKISDDDTGSTYEAYYLSRFLLTPEMKQTLENGFKI